MSGEVRNDNAEFGEHGNVVEKKESTKVVVGQVFTRKDESKQNFIQGYKSIALDKEKFLALKEMVQSTMKTKEGKPFQGVELFIQKQFQPKGKTYDMNSNSPDSYIYFEQNQEADNLRQQNSFSDMKIRVSFDKVLEAPVISREYNNKKTEQIYLNVRPMKYSVAKEDNCFQVSFVKDSNWKIDSSASDDERKNYYENNIVNVGTGSTSKYDVLNVQPEELTLEGMQKNIDNLNMSRAGLIASKNLEEVKKFSSELKVPAESYVARVLTQHKLPFVQTAKVTREDHQALYQKKEPTFSEKTEEKPKVEKKASKSQKVG